VNLNKTLNKSDENRSPTFFEEGEEEITDQEIDYIS